MAKKKSQVNPSAATTHFPSPISKNRRKLSSLEKMDAIAKNFREIMEILGLDLSDDSLAKTPYRVAKMYVEEVFAGLEEANFPQISFFDNKNSFENQNHMVFFKVSFTSFCEHHFVPMSGTAYVAYLPGDKIIGISKIHRIVRFFAGRPQLQERLTAQVADSLAILLQTEDVAVSIDARHYCVVARGIEDENSHTLTNVLRGQFGSNECIRLEFFEAINRKK